MVGIEPTRSIPGSPIGLIARVTLAIAAAMLLASCSTSRPSKVQFSEHDYGVRASPRVAYGRSVPKGGGQYMLGNPYRVAGRTYVPRYNPHYSAVGYASWYGSNFHGRRTANGEVYDMADLTAAHPTMPLPSYARVTNLANGRSIVVRVNDRGPYSRNRLIDVSSSVASILDFKRKGTARVQVDYVGPARLDGIDRRMLLATYRAPGVSGGGTMFASAPPPTRNPVVLAAAPAAPVGRVKSNVYAAYSGKVLPGAPRVLSPAFTPAALTSGDPLAPLILRTSFASSYAADSKKPLTPAQTAVEGLASGGTLKAAAEPPTASIGGASRGGVVVQLGSFSDPANAARIAAAFGRFGQVITAERSSGGKSLKTVRVVLAGSGGGASAVIAAASAAGLPGAFVVSR